MNEQAHQYLQDLVFARAHRRWHEISQPRGVLGRAMQSFLKREPAEAILLVKHDAADEKTYHCVGEPHAGWRLNQNGLCEMDSSQLNLTRWGTKTWPFIVVRFCIYTDPMTVFLNELTGPTCGQLLRMEPVRTKSGVVLKTRGSRRAQQPLTVETCPQNLTLPRKSTRLSVKSS